jgi:DNA-binding Lrp family transcriptional regulator
MVRTYLKKRNKPNVLEAVIQKAVRALQERRLPLTVAASRYGMTRTALHYRIKKISNGDECN